MKNGFLKSLLRSSQTVFTFKDLLLQWDGIDVATARKRVNYYIQTKALYPIRRGIYAKDENYDRFELATKIYTPAYISFETVLGSTGVTFQYYGQIFVASYQSKELEVDRQRIVFRTLKNSILINSIGVINQGLYSIATPERAFLDTVYLNKEYHFDQLASLDWDLVNSIIPIYGNISTFIKRVNVYRSSVEGDLNDNRSHRS
ncbi:MAG: hypothetical protein ACYDH2_11870 [Anaerolineaceae bacterium]